MKGRSDCKKREGSLEKKRMDPRLSAIEPFGRLSKGTRYLYTLVKVADPGILSMIATFPANYFHTLPEFPGKDCYSFAQP